MPLPSVVLASASPRRRHLLDLVGLPVTVRPAHIDESRISGPVEERVQALAHRKAMRVVESLDEGFVVAADTLGSVDGEALGKPVDEAEALRILWRLAGRSHDVVTGVTVVHVASGKVTGCVEAVERTRVAFGSLGLRDIQGYLATGEYEGKAGAYAIQGEGRRLVDHIDGSYTNVVGLPIGTTLRLLRQVDYPVPEVDVDAMEVLPDRTG